MPTTAQDVGHPVDPIDEMASQEITDTEVTTAVERQLEAQIRMYRAMERPAKADVPPILEWWNVNHAKIPLVANLARRYLCIPATSAPSERVFSTAGNNAMFSRYNLSTENIKRLVMIHENLPRVHKTIRLWKLTLAESEKFLAGSQTQTSQTPESVWSDEDSDDDAAFSQSQSQSLID